MFKKLQQKSSNPSFHIITPNSRTIPTSPSKDIYNATTVDTQPHSHYHTAQPQQSQRPQPSQQSHQPQPLSARLSSLPYDSPYDTYSGRESLIDPVQHGVSAQASGTSRQTFIEPNKSTMMQSSVTPLSVYGSQQLLDTGYDHQQHAESTLGNINFFQSTSDMESMAGSDIHVNRPSTIIQPRMQHVEMSVKIEKVNDMYAQASHATIENSSYQQQFQQHYGQANDDFILQPIPSRSTHSISTSSMSSSQSKSSRHPQPLPPLVIPPTPSRSVSSPHRALANGSPASSGVSSHQRSPLPSSSQLTPSLTPGSYGSSPMTVSPHTPSTTRQYLKSPIMASPSPSDHHQQQQQQQQQPYPSSPGHAQPSASQHRQQQGGAGASNSGGRKKDAPASEGEALLLEGIKYHESGKLEQATYYFHKAAQLQMPMAMFFYGVSLRHGWGCQKNEQVAFQYIQKAAEHAVLDLNSLSKTVNRSASKGELIMAIYEMGVSFRHGWGCRKNKETAVYFFKIAADLGDADAQNDLGHCYYNGQGVKKDVYAAAKYYRKADKQGHGIMGNSWIWKKKYDPK